MAGMRVRGDLVPFLFVIPPVWELWKTRGVRFPRSGGRDLCVHGFGSFLAAAASRDSAIVEFGHFGESALGDRRPERLSQTCTSPETADSDIPWVVCAASASTRAMGYRRRRD